MRKNLFVGVLGNRKSGKNRTWNTLFGKSVRTGSKLRNLYLSESEYVKVFLVSDSLQEQKKYLGNIIATPEPHRVLCSMRYRVSVTDTIEYFDAHDYFLFVHWLNPGNSDPHALSDSLGVIPKLLSCESLIGIRDGKASAESRVQEMRDFIYGWADSRWLLSYVNHEKVQQDDHEEDDWWESSREADEKREEEREREEEWLRRKFGL
jgi:hypothetical protein